MPVLPRSRGALRTLAGRGPIQRDLNADVDGYFDMLVDENVARGMSRSEARRQARPEMGGGAQVKDAAGAVSWCPSRFQAETGPVRWSASTRATTRSPTRTAAFLFGSTKNSATR